jgi:UDP-glucose 4-epimerase
MRVRLQTQPFTEMMPVPQDPYGIGKFPRNCSAERHDGPPHGAVIAVPHNVIGPRQKYDDPYRNVASIMINLAAQGRQPIIYGDGIRNGASAVQDDVEILKKLATHEGSAER